MSQENVDAVRRAFDGWNRGDFDAWVERAHPEVEWYSTIVGRLEGPETAYRGRAEMRQFWDESHAVWDLRIELTEIRDLGDIVLVLGHMRTHGAASGVDLEAPVGYVVEFEGGLIRKVRVYLDTQQALEAVGLQE